MARRGTTAKIELPELEKLCAMHCTDEEIAGFFSVSTRTIERRRKKRKFAETMERGKARGKISVRRAQLRMLEAGNATMGIWLGKQLLGQVDEVRHTGDGVQAAIIIMPRGRRAAVPVQNGAIVDVSPESVETVRLDGNCPTLLPSRTEP